jgi:hypothetical protein
MSSRCAPLGAGHQAVVFTPYPRFLAPAIRFMGSDNPQDQRLMNQYQLKTLLIVGLFGLFTNCHSALPETGIVATEKAPIDQPQTQTRIKNKIPPILFWVKRWRNNLISCPEGSPNQTPILADTLYSQFENQPIRMLTKETEQAVVVDLVEVNTQLRFPVIDGEPTSPPLLSFFCESPLENDAGHADEEFLMPKLTELREPPATGAQNNGLLSKISRAVQDWVRNSCTNPEESKPHRSHTGLPTIKITVPTFAVGDPEIYVLAKGNNTNDLDVDTILWFRFIIDAKSKNVDVILVKSFDRSEETRKFVSVIEQHSLKQYSYPCPAG